jgi:hypothetical protein
MTNHSCDCPLDDHYETVIVTAGVNTTLACSACAFQCLRCFGSGNLQCTVCNVGYYLANGTTFCLNSCPDGEYINSFDQMCYLCEVTCSSCKGTADNCTACQTNTGRYLLGNVCLTWCPNGYSWNNITRKCEECDYKTYSYWGACLDSCPDFYQADDNNRSCIALGSTAYYFQLSLEGVHVLSHGKLLQFTLLAQDGLNATSESWFKYNSYYDVEIIYKDSRLQSFEGVRTLANVTLPIRNLQYSNNRIVYTTNLP